MSIFADTRTLKGNANLGYQSIGKPIAGNTAVFDCKCLPHESGDYQWTVKLNKTDSDADAIAADFGSYTNNEVAIDFLVSTAVFVVGTEYFFALQVTDGSTSIECIQVSFTVAQNGIDSIGTTVLNFLSSQFTTSGDPITTDNKIRDVNSFKGKYTPFPVLSTDNQDANFVVSDYSDTTLPAAQNALLDAIDKTIAAGQNTVHIEGGTYDLINCELDGRPIKLIGLSSIDNSTPVTFKAIGSPLGSPTTATSVFKKAGSADYLRNVSFQNLIIDGDSDGQSALSGSRSAIQCGGMTDVEFINCKVKDGINYAVFLSGKAGSPTLDSGTVTFTQGSTAVTGTGTTFTSFVTEGYPLRSNTTGEESSRVLKVVSDTELILKAPWVHIGESGSEYVSVEPNRNCRVINSVFDKSGADDLFGGGFWYDSYIEGNKFLNGFGYGFGGTSCDNLIVTGNYAEGNRQGFGLERFYDCVFIGNQAVRNRSNGFYLVNGAHDNTFIGNKAYENTNAGFAIALVWIESAQKISPSIVRFSKNTAGFNGSHGFNVQGSTRIDFEGDIAFNNGQNAGSRYGFSVSGVNRPVTNPANPNFPGLPRKESDRINFVNCSAYDNQSAQTQVGGAFIDSNTTNVKFIGGDYTGNSTASINDLTGSAYISPSTTN